MADLGNLTVGLSCDLSNLKSGIGEAKIQITSVSDTASSTSSSFLGSIGSMAGGIIDFAGKIGLAINGVQNMYSAIQGMGQFFLGANADMEQTTTAFETLLGKGKATQDFLKQMQQFAAATPFEFPQVATAAQHFLAFGFAAKDVIPLLTNIGDAMGSMGKGAGDIDHIVQIFGQMHAASKLNAGDMMQLSSEGIPAWKMLADAMGKTVPEVQKLSSQGLIPADKAIQAVSAGMHKMFGGGMAAQAQTFNGLLSTFQDNISSAWRAFTGPLFDRAKDGLTDLGNLVSSSKFQDFATTLGKDVGGALNDVISTLQQVGNIGRSVFGSFSTGGIAQALHSLGDTFHDTIITIQKDLSVVNPADLTAALSDLFGMIGHGADIVSSISGLFLTLGMNILENVTKSGLLHDAFSTVSAILSEGDHVVKMITGDIGIFVKGIVDAITQSGALQSIFKTVRDILPAVGAFVSRVGSDLDNNLLPPIKSLITNVGTTIKNFSDWLDKSGTLKDSLDLLGGVVDHVTGLVGGLVNGVSGLVHWFNEGGPDVDLFKDAVNLLANALLGLGVWKVTQNLIDFANQAKNATFKLIDLADKLSNQVVSAFNTFVNGSAPAMKASLDEVSASETAVGTTASTTMANGVRTGVAESDAALVQLGTQSETTATQVEASADGMKTSMATAGAVGGGGLAAGLLGGLIAAGVAFQIWQAKTIGDLGEWTGEWLGHWMGLGNSTTQTAKKMSTDSISYISMMDKVNLDSVKGFTSQATTLLQGMGEEGAKIMQSLDKSTQYYWNDIAAVIAQKSQEAADIANWNLAKIHHLGAGIINKNFNDSSDVPGAASGVTNFGGGWLMVGEQGPEMMKVPQGTNVYPSGTPSSYSGSSGFAGGSSRKPATFVFEINGREFAVATADDIMNVSTARMRMKTGIRR